MNGRGEVVKVMVRGEIIDGIEELHVPTGSSLVASNNVW